MTTRALTWNDLILVAQRKAPADRVIAIAGVPARVKPRPLVDPGFSVRSFGEEYADEKWDLRNREHIMLLRQLVDAGVVTIDDDEDPWRLREWEARRRPEANPRCFVYDCRGEEIDERGPVIDRDGRMLLACPAHWEAIFAELGRQHSVAPDTVEIVSMASAEPVRVLCAICGADAETPHDADVHTAAAALQHRED